MITDDVGRDNLYVTDECIGMTMFEVSQDATMISATL